MRLFSARTIRGEAKRRGVMLLLHSTHLYKNLPQILEDGALHTVRALYERYGNEKAARFLHDSHRYEQFAVGLDYLNASLSLPNAPLLYGRSQSDWKALWVHLALDLDLLNRDDTLFSPVSAAPEIGKHVMRGRDGFRVMFAASVENFSRADIPRNVPTHPQAEVLVRGPLPISVVQSIFVPSGDVAREVLRLCELHGRSHIRIEVAPQLFVWPRRLMGKQRTFEK